MKTLIQIITTVILISALLSSCSIYDKFRTAWNPANRTATIAKLESDAVTVLGRSAFTLLSNEGFSSGNLGHTAAQAVWSSIHVGNIAQGITDAGGDPALAKLAESTARDAVANGLNKQIVINAVASAISSGALKSL